MEAVSVIAVLGMVGAIITSVNVIIEQCDRYYDNVNKALERINEISGGQFTVNLIETSDKLKIHYKDLISGMKKMVAAIQAVYDENKNADEQAANSLKGANSKY